MLEIVVYTVFPMLLFAKLLVPVAYRLELVDYPCERKRHATPTPAIGGVLVFAMTCWMTTTFPEYDMAPIPLLLIGGGLLFLGLWDDVFTLDARVRLVTQLIICGLFLQVSGLQFDVTLPLTPDLTIALPSGVLSYAFALVFMIAIVNAVNFIDGIDGAAASVVIVALIGLLSFQALTNISVLQIFIKTLLLIIFVFWLKNTGLASRGRMFLGDSGSTLLGFFVVALFLYSFDANRPDSTLSFTWIEAIFCIMLPLVDAFVVIVRRVSKKRSAFIADRTHLHHLFMMAGYSVPATWFMVVLLSCFFLAVGILTKAFAPWAGGYVLIALTFGYFAFFFKAANCVRRLRRIRLALSRQK